MTATEALRDYDQLWRELKRTAQTARLETLHQGSDRGPRLHETTPRDREAILAAMEAHCAQAWRLYEGRDVYRAAMWLRRLVLHRSGQTERVWDGADPVRWRDAYEAGRTAAGTSGICR